jgi:hypothetical protein
MAPVWSLHQGDRLIIWDRNYPGILKPVSYVVGKPSGEVFGSSGLQQTVGAGNWQAWQPAIGSWNLCWIRRPLRPRCALSKEETTPM